MLPNDFQEFQLLVPLRMKIKSIIEDYKTENKTVCPDNVSPDLDTYTSDLELDEVIQQTPPVHLSMQFVSSEYEGDINESCCSKQLTKGEQHTPSTSIQQKSVVKVMQTPVRTMRLPIPCPLPNNITEDVL